MPETQPSDNPHWTVDRRIPLAFILTLAVGLIGQTLYFGTVLGRFDTRLETAETNIKALQGADKDFQDFLTNAREARRQDWTNVFSRLTAVETSMKILGDEARENRAILNDIRDRLPVKVR